MSDEVYDPDGDISRYLHSPSLDSHVLAAAGDTVATPVVVFWAPQHALPPAHQGGVALPLPTPPAPAPSNLPTAFGGDDDVAQNHDAVPMDLQPMIDDLLRTMSLHDHYSMDDGGDDDDGVDALMKSAGEDAGGNNDISTAVAEQHAVLPVEEGLAFVPFVAGQLDCSKCRPAREVLHQSANHKLYFVVHDDPVRAFQHAIIDRTYINASGQTILNELMYADLRERTLGCVQNFIANYVDMLKNDTSGQLTDSCSASQANKHIELEMAMLMEILSAPSSTSEEVVVPQSGPQVPHQTVTRAEGNTNADDTVLMNTAKWPLFSPATLESSQVSVQDGNGMLPSSDASATDNESQLAKQRRRIAQLTMKDIVNLLHMSKKDAAKELNISITSLKRLCRKNNTDRWPARKINSLDSKIKKLQQAAVRNVGMKCLLAIKEKKEMLERERAQVYASVLRIILENQKNNDCAGGSSG